MRKRLLATLLVIALLASLMTTGVMAEPDEGGETGGSTSSTTSNVSNDNNGVHVAKSLSGTGTDEDPYKLTIEAFASNQTTTTTTTKPLDIVLVLDTSGSMDDAFTPVTISYAPTDKTQWSYNDIANSRTTYYVKVGDNYYEVEDDVEWNRHEGRYNYEIGYYTGSWGRRDWNQLGIHYNDPDAILYTGELYTITREGGDSKLESIQAAVDSFIDQVAGSSENHRISIVSFADGADTEAELTFVNSDGVTALKREVNQLYANGATNSAAGLEAAQVILSRNEREAEEVVVMFTDGTPTTASTFSESVASRAVNTAKSMKDAGVTVYTVGIFSGADPSDLSGDNNKYMNAVSSNYPNAEVSFESNWFGTWYYWDDLTLRQRGSDSEQYYFAADDADELENVFEGIADSITSGTLDNVNFEGSVFKDTLSEYVNFPEGIDESTDIEVKYAPVTAYDTQSETFSFGMPGDLPEGATATVDISGKTISVSGYDYKTYAATYNETTGEYSGGKLVITFPIELDEVACVENPEPNGMYPTNDELSLNYKVSGANDETSTTESPYIPYDVTDFDANGTDITVAVYLNGSDTPVNDPLNYVTIGRNTSDSNYRYFNQVGINGGVITYDFNYDAASGGNNCVDLDVTVGDGYFLQGVVSYQNEGSSGTDNVVPPTGTGTAYKIDNVTAVGNETDPDVKIYLYTAYSVEYYKDSDKLGDATGEEAYNDNNVYIIGESVIDTTEGDLEGEGSDWMNWQNTGYETLITVQSLPENTEGWTVGTSTTTVDPSSVTVDSVDEYADSTNVIKFNSTTKQDVSYTVEYYFDDVEAKDLTETGSGEIGTQINNYVDKADQAPDGQNYVLDRVENLPLTLKDDATQNVIEVYYALDEKGDDGPDGTPDKYQAFVDYEIVNGTWTGGKTTISQVYNFYEKVEGEWVKKDPAPTLANVPTHDDAVPSAGYSTPGTWTDSTPTAGSPLTMGTSYTYTYTLPGVTPTITVSVTNGTAAYGSDFSLSSTDDTVATDSFTVTYNDNATITFAPAEGYALESVTVDGNPAVFNGADNAQTYTFSNITDDHIIAVVYAADGNGDGTPDIHQATVTYKIVNGTWSDGKTDDIVYTVDVEEYLTTGDNAGTWVATDNTVSDAGTIPSDMKPNDNYVEPGQWDKNPDGNGVVPNEGLVYTYRYTTEKNQQYEITKELTSAKRGETTYTGESLDTYKARVGDELTYTITVENTGNVSLNNLTLTDTFTGAGTLNFDEAAYGAGYSVEDNDDGTYTITITDLSSESGQNTLEITATYTVEDGDVANGSFTNTVTDNAGGEPDEDDPTVPVEMDDYTVTITVADMLIYTGGNPYGGIAGADGDIIDETQTSGLPEPGYHLILSEAVVAWLNENDVPAGDGLTNDAARLDDVLTFSYAQGNETRNWPLSYIGRYSATQYVYRIEADTINNIPIRITYTNSEGQVVSRDDIDMSPNSVNETFTMEINPGDLNQALIKAVFEANGAKISAGIELVKGALEIRSTTGDEYTSQVGGDNDAPGKITADANEDTQFFINETQVELTGDELARVHLLVDDVSDSEEFNAAMGVDAISEAPAGVSLTNASYVLVYMDLVDSGNGNAVITMNEGGSVKVSWPMPADAAADSEFYIVHYTGLDRDDTITSEELASATKDIISGDEITVENGYITFNVSSFSPFALVYEQKSADAPDVEVTKTVSDRTPEVGDTVRYTVTVTNTGNTVLSNVTVTDTMWENGTVIYVDGQRQVLTGDEYSIDSIAVGSSVVITYYYSVTRSDANDEITNHVEVTVPDGPSDETETTIDVDPYMPNIPDPDDDPDPVEPDFDFVPNWLNTTDHFAYIVGYEDGTIRPTNNITRAEVATIFFRLLTDDAREEFWSQTNDYTDVASDAWYNNAVSTLSNMGIIDGYEDGTFKPNASITRAEFTAIATRFFDYTAEYEGAFNDVTYSDWYADCVQAAVDMGLVNGYADGGFHPTAYITRAESCAIVNRVLNRVPHEDYLLDEDEMITWPDNSYGAWYYADMQEATNSHDYDWIRVSGEVVEEWTDKLAERDWEALEQQWSTAYSG